MSEHAALLPAVARAHVTQLGVVAPACLQQLRTIVTADRAAQIQVFDEHTGHGIWVQTGDGLLVITATDPRWQLHDLAHLILGHRPHPTPGGELTPVLYGRATAGLPTAFTSQQERDAETMRAALAELFEP